jgi:hypothetical protein
MVIHFQPILIFAARPKWVGSNVARDKHASLFAWL